MSDLYETEKHTRVYHFKNGDTLLLANITSVRLDEDCISVISGAARTVIYRENLNYFQVKD
jgi:hypothetical protein